MKARRKLLIAGLFPAVLAAASQHAASAPLAATKPSQIVTLKNSENDCPFFGKALDQQLLPDGTFQSFAIPEKQVLVITEVEWGIIGAPASLSAVLVLSVQAPSAAASIPYFVDVSLADSAGTAGKTSAVANAIVRSGNSVCVAGGTGGTKSVILRGFLAKDR